MKNLVVVMDNELRVSHRKIAEYTKNQVIAIDKLINKYLLDFQEFGEVNAITKKVQTKGGMQKQKTYYLNEQQATLLLTYLRNSEFVRKFKKALVKEFFAMKEQLNKNYKGKNIEHIISGYKSQIAQKNKYIQELKSLDYKKELEEKDREIEELKKRLCQLLRWEEKKPVLPYRPFGRMILIDLVQSIQKQQDDLSSIIEEILGYRDEVRKYMFPILNDFDIEKRKDEIRLFFEIAKKEQERLKTSIATLLVNKGFVDREFKAFVKMYPEINISFKRLWNVEDFVSISNI